MDTCHAFKRPPADIALNTILTLAIIFAYIPQYRRIIARNSSQGLSTYYVLLHGLVSTQQFSSALLVYATPSNVFTCIKASGIRGFDIIGALLGLLQSFVQWSCALVLYVLNSAPSRAQRPSANTTAQTRACHAVIAYQQPEPHLGLRNLQRVLSASSSVYIG